MRNKTKKCPNCKIATSLYRKDKICYECGYTKKTGKVEKGVVVGYVPTPCNLDYL